MLIIVVGVLLGILLGLFMPFFIPQVATPYVAVALLAGLDSVFGGIAAHINLNFKTNVFVTGFFGNAFIAVIFVWAGRLLGFDLLIPCAVVLAIRIFRNFAIMRRHLLKQFTKAE
ncbi:MAG: small basic family protein [Eubacteriales bacterium]|nr:small basic family protein [Eubacteriales bacterium]